MNSIGRMLETGMSGLMSGDEKRAVASASAPALVLDSTIPQQNQAAREVEHSQEVLGVPFITNNQPAEVL